MTDHLHSKATNTEKEHRREATPESATLPRVPRDSSRALPTKSISTRAAYRFLHSIFEGEATIGIGSYGEHVRYLQKLLNEWIAQDPKRRGHAIRENGCYEKNTIAVVRLFQKTVLDVEKPNRIVGTRTLSELFNATGRKIPEVVPSRPESISRLSILKSEEKSFEKAVAFIYRAEGGLSNHKHDRGKLTNHGITAATLEEYHRLHPKTDLPKTPDKLTKDEAKVIYRNIWLRNGCASLPEPLAILYMDAALNHGPSIARRLFESAMVARGHTPTIAVAGRLSALEIFKVKNSILETRKMLFEGLVIGDSTQKGFADGWGNRLAALGRAILPGKKAR